MQTVRKCSLKLILPPGVNEAIFPWGVHLIQSYISHHIKDCTVEIIDLRLTGALKELDKQYGGMVSDLILELKDPQVQIIGAGFSSLGLYYGLIGFLGNNFFHVAKKNNLFRSRWMGDAYYKKYSKTIHELSSKIHSLLNDELARSLGTDKNSPVVWGMTVYDNTIFNALMLSKIIKNLDPAGKIVLGGDYFRGKYSIPIINSLDWIDGIVIGYGEEVITRVIGEYMAGVDIRRMNIPGLLNKTKISQADSFDDTIKQMDNELPDVPAFYFKLHDKGHLFVKREKNVIRILTQRGCSWGNCTFCNLIDRKKKHCFFPVPDIITALDREIGEMVAEKIQDPINLVLDGDESSKEVILAIIDYCNTNHAHLPIKLSFWFQAKITDSELGKAFAHCNKNLTIFAMANIESLNTDTLKIMKKGHSPLKALFTCKLLMDTLPCWGTNYFGYYPLEKPDHIPDEVDIIRKTLHIFMPPRCVLDVRAYIPSECDDIYANKDKFNIVVKHITNDIWMKDAFGLDLPFGRWAFELKESTEEKSYKRILKILQRFINTFKNVLYYMDILQCIALGKKLNLRKLYLILIKMIQAGFIQFAFKIVHWGLKNKSYIAKMKLLMYLLKLHLHLNDNAKKKVNKISAPVFFMQECTLYKDYMLPGSRERWTKRLNRNEYEILYYLYEIRNKQQIREYFKNRIEDSEIEEIMAQHRKLGTIIQTRDSYLSVANFPEYWKMH